MHRAIDGGVRVDMSKFEALDDGGDAVVCKMKVGVRRTSILQQEGGGGKRGRE